MKNKTCCFTGRRDLPTGLARWKLNTKLEKAIVEQIGRGIQFFGAGVPWALIPSRLKQS